MRSSGPRVPPLVGLLLALGTPYLAAAQRGAPNGEWHYHGGDSGTTKYSALDQIDRNNVSRLEVVWEWISADVRAAAASARPRLPTNFEGTTLMIGGVLYGTTSFAQAYALKAASGETLWVYDPECLGWQGKQFVVCPLGSDPPKLVALAVGDRDS